MAVTLTDDPYRKIVEWHFSVGGDVYALTRFDNVTLSVEETGKNGQEDTHFYGELELIDGKWLLDESSRKHLTFYESTQTADALEAFFDEHGLPEE